MNVLTGRPLDAPIMQMNEYSLDDVVPLFGAKGFGKLLIEHDRHGNIDTATILARRG